MIESYWSLTEIDVEIGNRFDVVGNKNIADKNPGLNISDY